MRRNKGIVPVLMFHSVGIQAHAWCWNFLSQPLEIFDEFLKKLVRSGFRTIGLPELQAHMRGEIAELRDAIVLTFDDGYLDNWVYVAPLLRRYGMHGTVFVNPEFVDPREAPRPTLQEVWSGRCSLAELQPAGFMNWEELRQLDTEGVLDVQSHALTHTWYFTGPKIVGWHSGEPLSPWPWMAWNVRPDRKPFYLSEDQSPFVATGHPVFEHRQALVARRFYPNESLLAELTEFVASHGGTNFFRELGWKNHLLAIIGGKDDALFPGAWESEPEQKARVRYEIGESREIIGRRLGKSVDYICWPAGGSDEYSELVAWECGYRGWMLRSKQEPHKRNVPGVDPVGIRRMGVSRDIKVKGRSCGVAGARFHLSRVFEHQKSVIHAKLVNAYKLAALVKNYRAPRP